MFKCNIKHCTMCKTSVRYVYILSNPFCEELIVLHRFVRNFNEIGQNFTLIVDCLMQPSSFLNLRDFIKEKRLK